MLIQRRRFHFGRVPLIQALESRPSCVDL
jgi:hypothetical protein